MTHSAENDAPGFPFDWNALGVDEGGLPVHLPMAVTADGQGPATGTDAHHMTCWCGTGCGLADALEEAGHLGERVTSPDEGRPAERFGLIGSNDLNHGPDGFPL
jgi:hypothetical protein